MSTHLKTQKKSKKDRLVVAVVDSRCYDIKTFIVFLLCPKILYFIYCNLPLQISFPQCAPLVPFLLLHFLLMKEK
jgi:hypothetical protein